MTVMKTLFMGFNHHGGVMRSESAMRSDATLRLGGGGGVAPASERLCRGPQCFHPRDDAMLGAARHSGRAVAAPTSSPNPLMLHLPSQRVRHRLRRSARYREIPRIERRNEFRDRTRPTQPQQPGQRVPELGAPQHVSHRPWRHRPTDPRQLAQLTPKVARRRALRTLAPLRASTATTPARAVTPVSKLTISTCVTFTGRLGGRRHTGAVLPVHPRRAAGGTRREACRACANVGRAAPIRQHLRGEVDSVPDPPDGAAARGVGSAAGRPRCVGGCGQQLIPRPRNPSTSPVGRSSTGSGSTRTKSQPSARAAPSFSSLSPTMIASSGATPSRPSATSKIRGSGFDGADFEGQHEVVGVGLRRSGTPDGCRTRCWRRRRS